jgi:hypothetical protein
MSPNPQIVLPIVTDPTGPRVKSSNEKHADGANLYKFQVLPVVQAAVRAVTEKECTSLFDVAPSALSEAVSGTSTRGRTVPLEWVVQLLAHGTPDVKLALLSILNDIGDCKPPERKEPITESEELRIARSVLRRYPGGIEMLEAEKDRYRP